MTKQTLNVTWEQDNKVFICLESDGGVKFDGTEYTMNIEIDGGLDEDEVMIAVFVYMDTHNIAMDDDCQVIFDGIAWEAA